jgi:hypothetical protein
MNRAMTAAAVAAVLAGAAWAADAPAGLEFRRIAGERLAAEAEPIPREAVTVSLFLGDAARAGVTEKHIAVEYRLGHYGGAGVLFDRSSGEPRTNVRVGGPGVVQVRGADRGAAKPVPAAEIEWGGRTWRALQPADFTSRTSRAGYADRKDTSLQSWSGILAALNKECFVEAAGADGNSRRYAAQEGLPSNIVTRFAAAGGALWAACADIFDPEKKAWGPGGLARFDPQKDRWERIETVAGRPVRWVTLLEARGDDLWLGFREGEGVEGDRIFYGMGISVGIYRPKATAAVLARLAGNEWKAWARAPMSDTDPYGWPPGPDPTEMPVAVALLGNRAFLFSAVGGPLPSYHFEYHTTGRVSVLDFASGAWRIFDNEKDVGQDLLEGMVAERGEVLLLGNRGVSRWDDKRGAWRFLDPRGELKNPMMSAAAPVSDDLWVGYTNQSFGVLGKQGISVFDEAKGAWRWIAPETIGTSCPVRRLIVLRGGDAAKPCGDVWAFFMPRPWGGAAGEFALIPHETRLAVPTTWGIGVFSGGRWTFPVAIRPKPGGESEPGHVYDAHPAAFSGVPREAVAVGDRLFVLLGDGLYAGPGQWKRIVEGCFTRLRVVPDCATVQLFRRVPKESGKVDYERLDYDPATGHTAVTPSNVNEVPNWYVFNPGATLWDRLGADTSWIQDQVRVPTCREGDWAVGPLGSGYHAVVETPRALWIASEGQLLRLDRARLSAWLGK